MTPAAAPEVSVLLPVRNGMPFLPAAVDSLLRQTLRNFELLVIDDGSSDGTADYLRGLADHRVRVLSSQSSGLASALNAGLAVARGRFIARHDADDWSGPERLERQVAWLRDRPDVDVLATAASFVNDLDEPVDSPWTRTVHEQWDAALAPDQIATLMPLTCCIFHATVLARAAILREAGGYDQATVPAEDYDLWLRLLPTHRFARLPERLYTVRLHAASSSAVRRAEQTARVIEAKLRYVRRQVPGLPWPVRMALPCADRGADLFRRVGPAVGYEPTTGEDVALTSATVVAVTDFAALPGYASTLAATNDYQQFGNVFVRR